MYHYLYKITNNFDECYYYGIHSTENLEDSYMGSGIRLWNAYNKHGIWNFHKEIIEYFETRDLALKREAEIVNRDLINDPKCYNIILGGGNSAATGTVTVKLKDSDKYMMVTQEEFYANKHLYETATNGKVTCSLKETDKIVHISVEEFYTNREKYQTYGDGKVLVKDSEGHCSLINKNDFRIQSGELTLYWKGETHSVETILKMKETFKKNKHQQGEKNSNYGNCWITKDGQSKTVKKDDLNLWLDQGWKIGRKINNTTKILKAAQDKIWINKDGKSKYIYKHQALEYKQNGWLYGRNSTRSRIRNCTNLEFWNSL